MRYVGLGCCVTDEYILENLSILAKFKKYNIALLICQKRTQCDSIDDFEELYMYVYVFID